MLRKEEARNRRSQARTVYKHLKGTHNKGRIAEEPGEGKLSSPVLEQRWAGRLTHRLSQIERDSLRNLAVDATRCPPRGGLSWPGAARAGGGRRRP
jgi:hypothetical protein